MCVCIYIWMCLLYLREYYALNSSLLNTSCMLITVRFSDTNVNDTILAIKFLISWREMKSGMLPNTTAFKSWNFWCWIHNYYLPALTTLYARHQIFLLFLKNSSFFVVVYVFILIHHCHPHISSNSLLWTVTLIHIGLDLAKWFILRIPGYSYLK